MKNIYIKEIFSSIQGEGPYIGYKQLFIRLCDCNLNCKYCDTDFKRSKTFQLYKEDNGVVELPNPTSVNELIAILLNEYKNFHSISFTGGEPLLQDEFLKEFINTFKKQKNTKYYLETNGTLIKQLKNVINLIDIVSMDIKVKSSTGEPNLFDINKEFIEIAKQHKKEIFVKLVISKDVPDEELEEVVRICKKQDISLILQPISKPDGTLSFSVSDIEEKFNKILNNYNDIRIIPQVHNYLELK